MSTLTAFQFFTNDFETETQGVDLVATLPFAFAGGQSSLILAFNWTDTQLKEITALADATRKIQLEDQLPGYRAILTGGHSIGPWSFSGSHQLLRFIHRRAGYRADASGEFDGKYGGELLVDLEVSYKITEGYRLSRWRTGCLRQRARPVPQSGDQQRRDLSDRLADGFQRRLLVRADSYVDF